MGIKADWVVFNGDQRRNNTLNQNILNRSAGHLDVQASKNTIALKVLQAYMRVLMAKELLNLSSDRLNLRSCNLTAL